MKDDPFKDQVYIDRYTMWDLGRIINSVVDEYSASAGGSLSPPLNHFYYIMSLKSVALNLFLIGKS